MQTDASGTPLAAIHAQLDADEMFRFEFSENDQTVFVTVHDGDLLAAQYGPGDEFVGQVPITVRDVAGWQRHDIDADIVPVDQSRFTDR